MPSPEHSSTSHFDGHIDACKKHLLEIGPGLVTSPVGHMLMSAEEALNHSTMLSLRHLGNFSLYFCRPDSIAGVYLTIPSRQRFAITNPELTIELEQLIHGPIFHVTNTDVDVDPRFVQAYELMRELVDNADIGLHNSDNEINPLYFLA